MYYEINISKNGRHYFATAERSLTEEEAATAAYWDLVARFPESEGFKITISRWEHSGREFKPKRPRKKAS